MTRDQALQAQAFSKPKPMRGGIIAIMDREIFVVKSGLSEAVLELGRQYAREDRSRGLGPSQQGAMLYYTANHVTGKLDRAPKAPKVTPRPT